MRYTRLLISAMAVAVALLVGIEPAGAVSAPIGSAAVRPAAAGGAWHVVPSPSVQGVNNYL